MASAPCRWLRLPVAAAVLSWHLLSDAARLDDERDDTAEAAKDTWEGNGANLRMHGHDVGTPQANVSEIPLIEKVKDAAEVYENAKEDLAEAAKEYRRTRHEALVKAKKEYKNGGNSSFDPSMMHDEATEKMLNELADAAKDAAKKYQDCSKQLREETGNMYVDKEGDLPANPWHPIDFEFGAHGRGANLLHPSAYEKPVSFEPCDEKETEQER